MTIKVSKQDIFYYLPNKERPISYSTKATADLISVLSEIFYSINDVQNAIFYDEDAIKILQIYIEKGYGERQASEFFESDPFQYNFQWYEKPYALLLSNFPFASTIEELKKYMSFSIVNGKRKWELTPLFKQIMKEDEK